MSYLRSSRFSVRNFIDRRMNRTAAVVDDSATTSDETDHDPASIGGGGGVDSLPNGPNQVFGEVQPSLLRYVACSTPGAGRRKVAYGKNGSNRRCRLYRVQSGRKPCLPRMPGRPGRQFLHRKRRKPLGMGRKAGDRVQVLRSDINDTDKLREAFRGVRVRLPSGRHPFGPSVHCRPPVNPVREPERYAVGAHRGARLRG